MNSLERTYCKAVFDKLKDNIKGKVFCEIYNDSLIVEIKSNGVIFNLSINHVSQQMNSVDPKDTADEIIKRFKQHVYRAFFK